MECLTPSSESPVPADVSWISRLLNLGSAIGLGHVPDPLHQSALYSVA